MLPAAGRRGHTTQAAPQAFGRNVGPHAPSCYSRERPALIAKLRSHRERGVTVRTQPATFEIARGVHWLPLRGANVYFVRSEDSWALIDAGFAGSGRTIAAAAGRLCGAAGRPGSIVITHGHPDHVGSAVGLAVKWNVPILAPAGEMQFIDGTALYPEPLVAWLSRLLPRRVMESLVRGSDLGGAVVSFDPQAGVPGLAEWVCVPTAGPHAGPRRLLPARRQDVDRRRRRPHHGLVEPARRRRSRLAVGPGPRRTAALRPARPWSPVTGPPRLASIVTLAGLDPWVLATGHGTPFVGRYAAPALRAFAARCAQSDEGEG